MSIRLHAAMTVALAAILAPAATANPKAEARKALDAYYAVRLKQPFVLLRPGDPEPKPPPVPWAAAVQQLTAAAADDRRAGAAHLRELLALALADETSGTAPWRNTPYWGGGADVPARDLREQVAKELAEAKPTAEALPLLRWYLDAEPADKFLGPVVEALAKHGDDADDLRAALAAKPHPNAAVTAAVLKQIAARKKALPADTLAALCRHHRTAVRTAARALHAQQDGKDPGPFDPAKAVRGAAVAAVMDRVLELLPDLPGAKAALVTVTVRYLDDKDVERYKDEHQGWLVRNEKGQVEIYSPYGRSLVFQDKERRGPIWVQEKAADGSVISSKIPVTVNLVVAPLGVDEMVKKVVEARKGDEPGNALSENGGLSGQFRGSRATLHEAILGAWLYRAGRDDAAAKVLLPAIDSLYRDAQFADMVRHRAGELAGQRMLVAFVGARDYPAAVRHARRINALYPGTRFHAYAQDFVRQLPARADDFTKLTLPTPAAWAALRKNLTRDEQIDYLCERMRLLNCFQMGQPGGYDVAETQYAEPCGLSDDAAWGLGKGKTVVINPLTELTGATPWGAEGKPANKGLELTVKDVPRLSKYVRHDHYLLVVSFWRNFAPDRSLSGTRSLFAHVINDLAKRDLVRPDEMAGMADAAADAYVQKVATWGRENAHKPEAQLLWEALDDDVRAGVPWGRLRNAHRLVELKDKRVLPVLQKYLAETTDEYDLHSLLYWCRDYDPKAFAAEARRFAKHKRLDLRLAAGHVLFAGADRAEGLRLFADVLENGSPNELEENAFLKLIEALLKDGARDAKDAARLIFKNKRYEEVRSGWVRAAIVRECGEAGIGDGYLSYVPLLEIKGNSIGGASYSKDTVVGELIAKEIVESLAPKDADILRIKKAFPAAADQIGPLKEWLRGKAKAASK